MTIKITNGRLILADRIIDGASLYLSEGKIKAITAESLPYDEELDAKVAEYSGELKIVMIALGIFVVLYLAYKGMKK